MRTYAIGDIHGHLDQLIDAHRRIDADRAAAADTEAPVVHVGDLVDRGPDSRGVIEYLRSGIEAGRNWVVLLGNHDRMFSGFLADFKSQDPGLRADLSYLHYKIGGAETLGSYGVKNAADRRVAAVHAEAVALVPAPHRDFLQSLPLTYERGDVLFVHAGIRPGVPHDQQSEHDLVWIRGSFLTDQTDHGKLIVHGHTAIDKPRHYGNRVNLDSGAAYGGPLSAVVLEGREAYHLTASGRIQLPVEQP